jgi:plasmid stabilization system protein ParE
MPGGSKGFRARQFTIVIQPRAAAELDDIFDTIARDSHDRAMQYTDRILQAVDDLSTFPERHPQARESLAFSITIRQVVVGSHRILFTVDGNTVRVLRIRSGWQDTIRPEEGL